MMAFVEKALERGRIPDVLIRAGIRRLNRMRLRSLELDDPEKEQQNFQELVQKLRESSIAVHTEDANAQHYEVPAPFFQTVLGHRLKYSSCHWERARNLNEAEDEMLAITCERADLQDGQDILELGCGWGSLSLTMAQKFPHARITGVSNSNGQREFIMELAQERGLKNLNIVTADINVFETKQQFDRVVSVEMFEHMRNYEALFAKVRSFLKPGGKLFVHIFVHARHSYLFEVKDETDWMSRYFFTGGIMPSSHLLLYFAQGFRPDRHWAVNGMHYSKTARAWLENMDANKAHILDIFADVYGSEAKKWFEYWRIFFMACEELFGWDGGREWLVNHYLFVKQ